MTALQFTKPEPQAKYCVLSYPAPGVLLVRLNRPKDLNCINLEGHQELDQIFHWLDNEPHLNVCIITGTGRAFCAGADLKELSAHTASGKRRVTPPSGFGALSRRSGRKPVIAAINGLAYGGGTEMVANCDIIIATDKATFSLPEVKRGIVAAAGSLPRIVRTLGRPRAMEIALTGRTFSAEEALTWGLINKVVGSREGEVTEAALEYAKMITKNSPDAVIASREAIKMGWEALGADDATRIMQETWVPRVFAGDNAQEGLRAFIEKRKPDWKPARL